MTRQPMQNVRDITPGTTVLITGGAGFIGSNLCDAVVEMGYNVRCMDNLISGKKENIEHLIGHPNFKFLETDLRDYESCVEAVSGVEIILHQAALGSVPRSVDDPITTNSININGTLNLLDAAQRVGVRRVVYAG
ncbi:MAG TPA: SDR family NAD(P)-dependent oxidoreductase, partial [Candidatus Poseidoniales archaeon]|nr:SDR family NAD(P)-dependent oxidoreductase [Candidatus Poseidoniales archaeon]